MKIDIAGVVLNMRRDEKYNVARGSGYDSQRHAALVHSRFWS
jgi:hypothetical protein